MTMVISHELIGPKRQSNFVKNGEGLNFLIYRKGTSLIFEDRQDGSFGGNTNEPKEASGDPWKSYLFFLNMLSKDHGIELLGDMVFTC